MQSVSAINKSSLFTLEELKEWERHSISWRGTPVVCKACGLPAFFIKFDPPWGYSIKAHDMLKPDGGDFEPGDRMSCFFCDQEARSIVFADGLNGLVLV